MLLGAEMIIVGVVGLSLCAVIAAPAVRSKNPVLRLWGCCSLSHGAMFACFAIAGFLREMRVPREAWEYYGAFTVLVMLWSIFNLWNFNREIHRG